MEIKHTQLESMLFRAYKNKVALFIAGTMGIGKSEMTMEVGKKIAKKVDRHFCDWNRTSDKEKLTLIEDRAKRESTFVFADVRISGLDPSDLRGLPKLNGKDYVEWKPTILFRLLSLDGVKAMLFFDEVNLAPPSIQASAYQIILDKCIGEIALNPEIMIVGAGNRAEDKANVFEMSAPLKNRFKHSTLRPPTYIEWIEWAMNNGIDDRIIAFHHFKASDNAIMVDLKKLGQLKDNAFPTPRTWKFCSDSIKGFEDLDIIKIETCSAVGDGLGIEFTSFCKLKEKIDLDDILANPSKIKDLELDMKWNVISGVSTKYKSNGKIMQSAFNLSLELEPDFGASLLRMMKRQKEREFVTNAVKCKNWKQVLDRVWKISV